MVEEVHYNDGELICVMNEYVELMFGSIEGGVCIHLGENNLSELISGEFFGEMAIIDS